MSKVRTYITGDAHLMTSIYTALNELADDSYTAFRQFTDLICEDIDDNPDIEHKAVIFAGDISNKNFLNRKALKALNRLIKAMEARNVPILSIPGNHDEDHSLAALKGITDIQDKHYTLGDKVIAGIGYEPTSKLKDKLADLNKNPVDLVVTHTALNHIFTLPDVSKLSLEDLEEYPNIRNITAGHIHTTDISKMSNDGRCVSPGSLHPTASNEVGPRGFMIWDIGEEPQFKELELRPIAVFNIRKEEDLKDIEIPSADFMTGTQPFVIFKFVKTLKKEIDKILQQNPDIIYKTELVTATNTEDEQIVSELLEGLKEDRNNASFTKVLTSLHSENLMREDLFTFLKTALAADSDQIDKFLDTKIEEMINNVNTDSFETG